MSENSIPAYSKFISGIKYVYLLIFFGLLSGIFYPIIKDAPADSLFFGILILFLGLGGGILVYKGITSKKLILTPIGLALMIISLLLLHQLTRFPLFEV